MSIESKTAHSEVSEYISASFENRNVHASVGDIITNPLRIEFLTKPDYVRVLYYDYQKLVYVASKPEPLIQNEQTVYPEFICVKEGTGVVHANILNNLDDFSVEFKITCGPSSVDPSELQICKLKNSGRVETDKFHYSPGDMMHISGCVADTLFDKDLKLTIWASDEEPLSTNIELKPDGTFEKTVDLNHFTQEGFYHVGVDSSSPEMPNVDSKSFTISQFGKICSTVSDENQILVFTDKENYQRGDVISVVGCLSEELASQKGYRNLDLVNKNGIPVSTGDSIYADLGVLSKNYVVDESFPNGTYVAVMSFESHKTTKTITVPEFKDVMMSVMIAGFVTSLFIVKKFIVTKI